MAERQLEQGKVSEATAFLDAAQQALTATDAVLVGEIISIASRLPKGERAARLASIESRFPEWRSYLQEIRGLGE